MLESIVMSFDWPKAWTIDHKSRTVQLSGTTFGERNANFASTLRAEHEKRTFKCLRKWSGELVPVYGPHRELVLSIEESAAPLFGVLAYGVQLLDYHEVHGELRIWIAKRAMSKSSFPGMLDSTAGGSITTGETPLECLIREAEEEACFPASITRQLATSRGILSYIHITDERAGGEFGLLRPEVQYLYEMKTPAGVIPIPGDDEVEMFRLLSVPGVRDALARGQFTPANGCVVLGFLIRHGIVTAENEKDYVEIVSRLNRKHDLPTR